MATINSISLYYSDIQLGGSSDKEYRVFLEKDGDQFRVIAMNGRRGGTMVQAQNKLCDTQEQAEFEYNSLVNKKMKGGYQPAKGDQPKAAAPIISKQPAGRTPCPAEKLLRITEAEADKFLASDEYWLQVKADGHFAQIEKRTDRFGDSSYIRYNKLGEAVATIPSEIAYDLNKIKANTFFIEGELIGTSLIAYNLLEKNGTSLIDTPYHKRFTMLESMIVPAKLRYVTTVATWRTRAEKIEGRKALIVNRCEGEVYKMKKAVYRAGESGQHPKYKYEETLSAIVTGLGHKGKNNAVLSLYDGKKLVEVGRCSLNGKQKVNVNDIIEVKYLYGGEGRRLVQPRMIALRDDVRREECTVKQIKFKQGVEAA